MREVNNSVKIKIYVCVAGRNPYFQGLAFHLKAEH